MGCCRISVGVELEFESSELSEFRAFSMERMGGFK